MKEFLYDWDGANHWLFHVVNNWRGPLLDRLMRLGTQAGTYQLFPVYLAIIVVAATVSSNVRAGEHRTQKEVRALAWLAVLSVLCTASLIDGAFLTWAKDWFSYPRPLAALPPGSVIVVGEPEYRLSLPSGHASFAMLIAASLWPMLGAWLRPAAALFVVWVGVSRVNVGAHFPADVVASWLTALMAVLITRAVLNRGLDLFQGVATPDV